MKKITYSASEGPLSVNIKYSGRIYATYMYDLWEPDGRAVKESRRGSNFDQRPDEYPLPFPISSNAGRFLELNSVFDGPEARGEPYEVIITLNQGGKPLGEELETGLITGHLQRSRLLIMLVPEE